MHKQATKTRPQSIDVQEISGRIGPHILKGMKMGEINSTMLHLNGRNEDSSSKAAGGMAWFSAVSDT